MIPNRGHDQDMADAMLKTGMRRGDILADTFLKTPAHDMVEVLATTNQIVADVHAFVSQATKIGVTP